MLMDEIRQGRWSEKSVADVRLILQGKYADSTFLETSLENNYKIGLAPFKFGKNGAIVNSTSHKVANVMLWIVFSGLWGLHQWNTINDAKHYHGLPIKAFAFVTTIGRIRYWYQWTDKQQFTKLLKRLHSERFINFFRSQNSYLFRLIRWTSLLLSLVICGFGLNVIPTSVFQSKEWSWETVLLAHDYSLKPVFSGWLIKSEDHCEKWPGTWSGTTVPFGLLGILLGFCVQLCDTFMFDMVLCSSLELLKTTRELHVDFEPPLVRIRFNELEYLRTGFEDMFVRVHQVLSLSDELDGTLKFDDISSGMFWGIAPGYGMHLCKHGDWVPAILYTLYISKRLLHCLIQYTISLRCKRFSKFVHFRVHEEYYRQNSRMRKTASPGS